MDDLYADMDDEIKNTFSNADEYELEHQWEDEYGQDGKGSWWYLDNIDTNKNILDDAMKEIEKMEDVDEDEIDMNDFVWHPEMELSEYIDEMAAKHRNDAEYDIEEIVNKYKDSNMKLALSSKVEVMFKCNSYILIERVWEKIVKDFLINGKVPFDPRQTEFEFEKDKSIKNQFTNIIPSNTFRPLQPVNKKYNKLKQKYKEGGGDGKWWMMPNQKNLF